MRHVFNSSIAAKVTKKLHNAKLVEQLLAQLSHYASGTVSANTQLLFNLKTKILSDIDRDPVIRLFDKQGRQLSLRVFRISASNIAIDLTSCRLLFFRCV